jgi:tetrapyrrole methylase family protein/MazG family protein
MTISLPTPDATDPKNLALSLAFLRLIQIVAALRNPQGGCPWDLEQTHESLKPYLIEEAYEVIDAIDNEKNKLPDELGDVLLQVILHSQIASEANSFTIEKVLELVSKKLVTRHPHVFADESAKDTKEVLQNWEMRKQKELAVGKSILDGVPRGMPALLRAQRIGDKAARVGFEWNSTEEVRDKVIEEVQEFLAEALKPEITRARLEDEFGDILFSLTQLSRRLGLNSEDLLQRSADKFTRRFKKVEERAQPSMKEYTLEQLDEIWDQVKREEG